MFDQVFAVATVAGLPYPETPKLLDHRNMDRETVETVTVPARRVFLHHINLPDHPSRLRPCHESFRHGTHGTINHTSHYKSLQVKDLILLEMVIQNQYLRK